MAAAFHRMRFLLLPHLSPVPRGITVSPALRAGLFMAPELQRGINHFCTINSRRHSTSTSSQQATGTLARGGSTSISRGGQSLSVTRFSRTQTSQSNQEASRKRNEDIKSYLHNNCKVHFLGRPRYIVESLQNNGRPPFQCTIRLSGRAKGIDFIGKPGKTKKAAEWNSAILAWAWIKALKPLVRDEKQQREEEKAAMRRERRERRKLEKQLTARWEEWKKKYEEEQKPLELAKWRNQGERHSTEQKGKEEERVSGAALVRR